jgi:5-deoxy-D-glucuronate isomerase
VRAARIAGVTRTDGVCGFATVALASCERTGEILQIVEICLECRQQVEVDLSRASMHERRVRPTCDEAEATKQLHQTQTGEATMMADILSVMAPAAAPAVKKAVKRRIVKKAVKRRIVKKAVKRRVVKKVAKKAATKRAVKKVAKKAVKRRATKKAATKRATKKAK